MSDVFQALERFSWRGIEMPCSGRGARFRQNLIDHTLQYRDGQFVESTGAGNWEFTYRIPARDGITAAPWANVFSLILQDFVSACRDRSDGALVDPFRGRFVAKCSGLEEEASATERDGVDLVATFVESPDVDATDDDAPVFAVDTEAARLSDPITEAFAFPDAPIPPLPIDALAQLEGLGRQVQRQGSRVAMAMDGVSHRCEQLEEMLDGFDDVDRQLVASVRRLNLNARKANQEALNPSRRIRRRALRTSQTHSEIAAEFGITVDELLDANESLVSRPIVDGGTVVNYYSK